MTAPPADPPPGHDPHPGRPPDPYTDPDTGVLHNLLAARTEEDLARRETNLTAAALYRLDLNPVPGHYDLPHLQAIHTALYADIYPWAGQPRTIHIGKDGEVFCPPQHIHTQARQIFDSLAAEDHLRGLDLGPFTDRLAHYYADLNHLHPFREGNGHTQRALFTQLARDAGYEIRWEHLDPHANIEACRETFYGDRWPLRILFSDIVHPHHPLYGTPAETTEALHHRAEAALGCALNLAAQAHQWFELGQPGPNQQRLAAHRRDIDTHLQAIDTARKAQADYHAGLSTLEGRETEQRRLLSTLNATDDHGRATLRGTDRTRLQQHIADLGDDIDALRRDLLHRAALTGHTSAAAPPAHTWATYQQRGRDLTDNWQLHLGDARHADRVLTAGRYDLSDWLTHYADELAGLAEAIHTGQLTPEQAQTPLAAETPLAALDLAPPPPDLAARPPAAHL
jgi:cell filamentation protein